MINTTLLEEVINDQLDNFKRKDTGITRNVDFVKYIRTKQITVISGIRRSWKLSGQNGKIPMVDSGTKMSRLSAYVFLLSHYERQGSALGDFDLKMLS